MPLNARYLLPLIDPSLIAKGACYTICKDSPSLGDTNENPLILIKNTTTSTSLLLFMRRLQARSAYSATLRVYSAPTITTVGTAATPAPLKVGGVASTMLAYTGSTIGANGTLIDAISNFDFVAGEVSDIPIILPAGTNMLVTLQASNTGAAVLAQLAWAEVA